MCESDREIIKKYFEEVKDDPNKKYKCILKDCKGAFKNWRTNNLKRHISDIHPSLYHKLFVEKDVLNYEIEAIKTIQAAVEMCTVNGCSFSTMNHSGFKKLIAPTLKRLQEKGHDVYIDRTSIIKDIQIAKTAVFERIKNETKNRYISLCLDVATKNTLSVLGVNIQYIYKGTIVNRSIGVIPLDVRHRGVHLAKVVSEHLTKYGIGLSRVYSVTKDNASNMTTTVQNMNGICVADENDEDDIEQNEAENFNDYQRISMDSYIELLDEYEIDENDVDEDVLEIQNVVNNGNQSDVYDTLLNEVAEEFSKLYGSQFINHAFNCGAHTLQLAVNDALERSNCNAITATVKQTCHTMRTKNVMLEIRKLKLVLDKDSGKKKNVILPPVDVPTRWNSTYIMVKMRNLSV